MVQKLLQEPSERRRSAGYRKETFKPVEELVAHEARQAEIVISQPGANVGRITSKKLVAAFAAQSHFDVLAGELG